MRPGEQGRHGEREAGGELLHRAAHHRMRLGLMTALQDGTQRPAARSQACSSRKPRSKRTAETFLHRFGSDQQNGAGQADQHPDDGGSMQSIAAGNERFDADHPERRHRNEDRCQAAGHPLLGEHQAARAGADDDDAEQRGVPEFAPGGKMRFRKIRDQQQDDSGDGVAQSHQHRRRHGFERDADAEVSGAPEETDRGQRQVRLKMRMARQNSG